MDLNRKNMKRLALLIAFALVLYWGLSHPSQAGQLLSAFFSLFLPFVLGGCLAFLLNVLLRPVERGWQKAWGKGYGPKQEKAKRPSACWPAPCWWWEPFSPCSSLWARP